MRAISSAASVSIHAAVAAALLLGRTHDAQPAMARIDTLTGIFTEPSRSPSAGVPGDGTIQIPRIEWSPGPMTIPAPPVLQPGALTPTFSPDWAAGSPPGESGAYAVEPGVSAAAMPPAVLSGPLPQYPELLRQAGVEGQVVLEARVDSGGRVQKGSVSLVFATHPGLVEPARQALMATLFRPARVNGRAVAMLVRVPFAFSIRGGTGRAR